VFIRTGFSSSAHISMLPQTFHQFNLNLLATLDCHLSMYIFIKSTTSHKHHRDVIRNLTGGVRFIGNTLFRTIFVTGNASGEPQESIEREAKVHGDILQIAVPDSYR